MRTLYARIVLWLIRPALELRSERRTASPETAELTLDRISRAIDNPNSTVSKSLTRNFDVRRFR